MRNDFYWGGGSYALTPVVTLIGAIYYQKQKNLVAAADPLMYSLRLKYALPKRTDLYASGAYAKAKNNQLISLSRNDVGYGSSQIGMSLGMQHRF